MSTTCPTLAGGVGHDMLKRFYKYHFVAAELVRNAPAPWSRRPWAPDRIVLETVVRFRHDRVLDRYFPGHRADRQDGGDPDAAAGQVPRRPGVPRAHLLGPGFGAEARSARSTRTGLPVAGAEAAAKVLDETRPSNVFMRDAWAESEGKPI